MSQFEQDRAARVAAAEARRRELNDAAAAKLVKPGTGQELDAGRRPARSGCCARTAARGGR